MFAEYLFENYLENKRNVLKNEFICDNFCASGKGNVALEPQDTQTVGALPGFSTMKQLKVFAG